jgi:hypothetical protein
LSLLVLLSALAPAYAARRIALLIGNGDYTGVSQLKNPKNDAKLVAASFTRAGFDQVSTKFNLARDELIATLRAFEDEAAQADVAVIYFSGHGFEINGENYIVPVDARLLSDRDVEDEAVSLSRVLRTVEGARRLRLVILDACRDNPFLVRMSRARATKSVAKGLTHVEPRLGETLVAYAAKAGTVAWDGAGQNSPFSLAVADRLIERGLDIRIALGKVRDDVMAATDNQQEPFSYGSLGGSTVTLWDAPPAGAADGGTQDAPLPCKDAALHWASVQRLDKIDLFRKHIERFGDCGFADLARARIAELEKGSPSEAPPPAAAVAAAPELAPSALAPDEQVWAVIKDSRDIELFREFLLRHPSSRHKDDALRRLAVLSPTPDRPAMPSRPTSAAPTAGPKPKPKPQTRAATATRRKPTVSTAAPAARNCFTFDGRSYCE